MSNFTPVIRMTTTDGIEHVFDSSQIIDGTLLQEFDPVSVTLPISTLNFKIYSTDPRLSIFSDGVFFQSLARYQAMSLYEIIEGNEVFLGKFYLMSWEQESKYVYNFKCEDIVGLMDKAAYDGKFWSTPTYLSNAIKEVMEPAGLPYEIDSTISTHTIMGWIPPCSVRQAVQQILFASRTMLTSDRRNEPYIFAAPIPAPYTVSQYGVPRYGGVVYTGRPYTTITSDERSQNNKIKVLPLVTRIELVSHSYSAGNTLQDIYSATLEPGEYKIIFDSPYYGVTTTGVGSTPVFFRSELNEALASNVGIDYPSSEVLAMPGTWSYGSNSVILNVYPPGGDVLVKGYSWIVTKRGHIWNEPDRGIAEAYDLVISDATLVNASNVEPILQRLSSYYQLRHDQHIDLFPRNDVQLGKLMITDTDTEKDLAAIVTRIEVNLGTGFMLRTSLLGTERIV